MQIPTVQHASQSGLTPVGHFDSRQARPTVAGGLQTVSITDATARILARGAQATRARFLRLHGNCAEQSDSCDICFLADHHRSACTTRLIACMRMSSSIRSPSPSHRRLLRHITDSTRRGIGRQPDRSNCNHDEPSEAWLDTESPCGNNTRKRHESPRLKRDMPLHPAPLCPSASNNASAQSKYGDNA